MAVEAARSSARRTEREDQTPAATLQAAARHSARRRDPGVTSLRDYIDYLTPKRVGKLLFGVAVSLIVGEVSLYWLTPMEEFLPKDIVTKDAELGFRMVPNYVGTMVVKENATPFSLPLLTNSWGLRDREYGERPAGGMRVYVIGDSMIFGYGVPVEQTFTRFLEKSLQQQLGRPIEAVNGGVPGYGTGEELGFFERTADTVKPDVVLLAFNVFNDVDENINFTAAAHKASRLPSWLDEVRLWLRQRSQLYLLVRRYKAAARTERILQVHRVEPPARIVKGLATTEDLLARFAQAAASRGVRFAVVLIPNYRQVFPTVWAQMVAKQGQAAAAFDPQQPNARLTAALHARGIPVIDLLPVLRAHVDDALYYSVHWKAPGHELVAKTVADFMLGSGLLAPAPAVSATAAAAPDHT
ncbi:MAG: SGNH/GDSL hydrolase family protein [Deltaproteobacteria bacterium]|nr:SGNH/GDSL hydrolase family protein [Deltaproteobacteria bacterium]